VANTRKIIAGVRHRIIVELKTGTEAATEQQEGFPASTTTETPQDKRLTLVSSAQTKSPLKSHA